MPRQLRKRSDYGYVQKMFSLDPAQAERFHALMELTGSRLNIKLKAIDMFTLMMICTEMLTLNPTFQAKLELANGTAPSVQTMMRVQLLKEAITKLLASENKQS